MIADKIYKANILNNTILCKTMNIFHKGIFGAAMEGVLLGALGGAFMSSLLSMKYHT
jgi:hypothetical protein